MIPAEKLFISISNPGLIFPSINLSKAFIANPPRGPAIIAPRNIGISAPTTTPIVVMAPTTPPLFPPTIVPPVYPIKRGRRYDIIGPTKVARLSFGNHPFSINNAVISPQAIKAPIFGITMALRNLPNFCTCTLAELSLIFISSQFFLIFLNLCYFLFTYLIFLC